MSFRASDYARATLEQDPDLGVRARLVFMLLAERANNRTGTTFTGDWLHTAAGARTYAPVRRALTELAEAGYITVEHRPGKSHRIGFPVVAPLSTACAPADRENERAYPARQRTEPCASARTTLRADASRTSQLPDMYHAALCSDPACVCEGTGWEHVADGARGYVRPCPTRTEQRA